MHYLKYNAHISKTGFCLMHEFCIHLSLLLQCLLHLKDVESSQSKPTLAISHWRVLDF